MITIKEIKEQNQNNHEIVFEAAENGIRVAVGRFAVDASTISIKQVEWDTPENLDGLLRTAFFSAFNRKCTFFSVENQDKKTAEALFDLGIPQRGSLQVLFSGGCKGGCEGDCTRCRG